MNRSSFYRVLRVLVYPGWVLCASVAILIASSSNAYAYIDPGYGALLWQLLIAGFFGTLFYARNIIAKIKSWLKPTKTTVKEEPHRPESL